jgi:molecular chaperone Hsp33
MLDEIKTIEKNKKYSIDEKDSVVRFLFEDCAVRGVWVSLQQSLADMLALKNISQAAGVLLGESVAAAVLLSCTIKLQGRVAIQARGDGALQLLVAESTQNAGVRGIITLDETAIENSMPSLKQLIGNGYLAVTLLPDDGESYQGIVPLQGERMQDCLADYFELSEQLPTALWLVSDGECAAGLLLQAMPTFDGDIDSDDASWQHLHTLASTLKNEELLSLPCEELLHRLFHRETVRVFDPESVHFQCTCSEQRSRNALAVLGREELEKLFSEQPNVIVDCQFCDAQYHYAASDMAKILGETVPSLH